MVSAILQSMPPATLYLHTRFRGLLIAASTVRGENSFLDIASRVFASLALISLTYYLSTVHFIGTFNSGTAKSRVGTIWKEGEPPRLCDVTFSLKLLNERG